MDVTLENAPQGAAEGAKRAAGETARQSLRQKDRVRTTAQGQALFLRFLPRCPAVLSESDPEYRVLALFVCRKKEKGVC